MLSSIFQIIFNKNTVPKNDNKIKTICTKTLIITNVARNIDEHPGFDDSLEGQYLYDFIDMQGNEISCSLYDYEIVPIN